MDDKKDKKDKKQNEPVGDELDPFDPSKLKLSQDFAANIGVKKALVTVPVRKPDRQTFVRVHPDVEYRLETAVLELKEERETYLVEPALWSKLPGETVAKTLVTAMNRQGVLFLWHIRLPDPDDRIDEWNRTALDAAHLARKKWIRVASNHSLGAYEVIEAPGQLPEPTWPKLEFSEILRIAFRDHFITSLDHPVVQRLRGLV